jgi:putative ABC transport system permease protein
VRHFLRRLHYLFQQRRLESDLAEEMAFHRELKEAELARNGHPPGDVALAANRALGSALLARERSRDIWSWQWLEGLLYDLRFAIRGLWRDKAFSSAAIATLALAIGLNVATFNVVNAMLFRGAPLVKGNNRLVYLQKGSPTGGGSLPYPDFAEWRSARAFDGVALIGASNITLRSDDGRLTELRAATITANAFSLLGVPPLRGRDFLASDEAAGAAPVAILSYSFWETRFNKRDEVIGSTIQINGAPGTIIGVMPERFNFPSHEDLWMPIVHSSNLLRRGTPESRGFLGVARLREGMTQQGALAEVNAINSRVEAVYPEKRRGVVPTLRSYSQITVGSDAPMIYGSLWTGAWFVLLIACANVANLTLVRTTRRGREFSTRIALGAGHWRMIRQILIESLLLATVAGAVAWWMSTWSVRWWEAATASHYQVLDYAIDGDAQVYLLAVIAIAIILCSLGPIVSILRRGAGAMNSDARGATRGVSSKRLSAVLVMGQMALAMVLLAGAGVLARSLSAVVNADTGVRNPDHVLVGLVRIARVKFPNPASRLAYLDRLDSQLKSVPGVVAEAIATSTPMNGGFGFPFEIESRSTQPDGPTSANFLYVGSEYFRVLGLSALAGREFNTSDRAGTLPVAIVNQRAADLFWPSDNPIGKRLRANSPSVSAAWRTVVGIIPDIKQGGLLRQTFGPVIYLPAAQEPPVVGATNHGGFKSGVNVLVRTSVPPHRVAQAVRTVVQQSDPDVSLEEFSTMKASFAFQRDRMDLAHGELGKYGMAAPIFAVMAFLLAIVGLYAVIAHSVSQRTRELGVRIAIGAKATDIWRLVFREGMTPVVIGMFLGLVGALGVNRVLQSQLVGVSPYDPMTMAGAPMILFVVALLACLIPARRAMRVAPAIALRHD